MIGVGSGSGVSDDDGGYENRSLGAGIEACYKDYVVEVSINATSCSPPSRILRCKSHLCDRVLASFGVQ